MSSNWAEVCRKVGVKPATGSQGYIARLAKKLDIPFTHFTGVPAVMPSRSSGRQLEDYLSNKFPINSNSLKWKLIKAGIKEEKCETCGGTEWLGDPMPLELDHENGDHEDNRLENLKIRCPNCHSVKTKKQRSVKPCKKICPGGCGRKIQQRSHTCSYCQPKDRKKRPTKIRWPELSVLIEAKKTRGISRLARLLGVSGNAIHRQISRARKKGLI